MSPHVVVARRELIDLVERVLRVDGTDPGAARRIAAAVVDGESSGHEATRIVLDLVDRGAVGDLLESYDAIVDAELTARREGSARVEFGPPAPEALLIGPLAESAARGVARVTSSSVGGRVSAIDVMHRPDVSPPSAPKPQHELPMASELFDDLTRRATAFLVAESVLDALPSDAPGSAPST